MVLKEQCPKRYTSIELLLNVVKSLISKVTNVNPNYNLRYDSLENITNHNSREFTRGFAF